MTTTVGSDRHCNDRRRRLDATTNHRGGDNIWGRRQRATTNDDDEYPRRRPRRLQHELETTMTKARDDDHGEGDASTARRLEDDDDSGDSTMTRSYSTCFRRRCQDLGIAVDIVIAVVIGPSSSLWPPGSGASRSPLALRACARGCTCVRSGPRRAEFARCVGGRRLEFACADQAPLLIAPLCAAELGGTYLGDGIASCLVCGLGVRSGRFLSSGRRGGGGLSKGSRSKGSSLGPF